MTSVLVGNGININFGGKAYSNRFIMTRMKYYAGTGEYDKLFEGTLGGNDIIRGMEGFVNTANSILSGKYNSIDDPDVLLAVQDFQARNSNRDQFLYYHEIPMEDWFLLLELFYFDNPDLADQKNAAKQGMERMVLDAIYNGGRIQNVYQRMNRRVKRFFNKFDTIFTLNYDNNLEKLCEREVLHLHGDYSVLADSENPNVAQGFYRETRGQRALIPGYEHCFCNALLDYSGELKYQKARNNALYTQYLSDLRVLNESGSEQYYFQLSEIAKRVPEAAEWIETYITHPDLGVCTNYHFAELESLSGELHIIGLSPNNDSHIFRCIDRSHADNVVFYYNSRQPASLPLSKPYCFKSAPDLWAGLDAQEKRYNRRFAIPNTKKGDDFINALNAISFDVVTREEMMQALHSIPEFVSNPLCEEAVAQMKSQKESGPIRTHEEQRSQFMAVGSIALREGILPSVFYMLLVDYMNKKHIAV